LVELRGYLQAKRFQRVAQCFGGNFFVAQDHPCFEAWHKSP
jgi:hypothetical protein